MDAPPPLVRFDRVGLASATEAGGRGASLLDDLSLALEPGSFTWLLGPPGAGKTVVLRLMHADCRPSRGAVELLGVALGTAPRAALPPLRRRIGLIPQEPGLLPHLSLFENVALPLRIDRRPEARIRQEVSEMLDWLGLADRAALPPPRLDAAARQGASIARAVVARPALLLADEPTRALEAAQAARLLGLFGALHRLGTTLVIASRSEAEVASHPAPVLRLEGGRMVGHGG